MSEYGFDVYINPKDEIAEQSITNFVNYVKNSDFQKIIDLDKKDRLFDLDHYFDKFMTISNVNGIINIGFSTFISFDIEDFLKFLLDLGTEEIEASIYDTQCGETYYYKNTKNIKDYTDTDWKWLKEQDED